MTPASRKGIMATSIHRNQQRVSREIQQAVQELCRNEGSKGDLELNTRQIFEMVEKLIESEQDDLVRDNPQLTRNTKVMIKGFVQKQLGKNK